MLLLEHLRRYPLFALAKNDLLRAVCESATLQRFDMGEVLFREREQATSLYVLKSGRVRIIRKSEHSQEITLSTAHAGELIGDYSLLSPHIYPATGRVSADGQIWQIPIHRTLELWDATFSKASLRPWLQLQFLIRFLRNEAYLGFMSAPSFLQLLDQGVRMEFAAGESIQAEGLHADSFFLIQEGTAISRECSNDSVATVVSAGEFCGLSSLMGRDMTHVTTAQIPVVAWQLRRYHLFGDAGPGVSEQSFQKSRRPLSLQFPFIRQETAIDCGAAALAMLARFHHRPHTLSQIRELLTLNDRGASLDCLIEVARQLGFTARAIRTTPEHLVGITLPAVAHLTDQHYVVLYAMDRDQLVIGDPERGILNLSMAEFRSVWGGILLLATPLPA